MNLSFSIKKIYPAAELHWAVKDICKPKRDRLRLEMEMNFGKKLHSMYPK